MGMSIKEETLDWLYRLRSDMCIYIPTEWLRPMNDALDVAIDTVEREKSLEDWTKKCRKFEADYENRLKADMVAMLTEIQLEIDELPMITRQGMRERIKDIIKQKINSLKEIKDGSNNN